MSITAENNHCDLRERLRLARVIRSVPRSTTHCCLVAFDIPEKRRTARNALRRLLRSCGFIYLQRSVWQGPAGIQEHLERLLRRYGFDEWTIIMEVKIE